MSYRGTTDRERALAEARAFVSDPSYLGDAADALLRWRAEGRAEGAAAMREAAAAIMDERALHSRLLAGGIEDGTYTPPSWGANLGEEVGLQVCAEEAAKQIRALPLDAPGVVVLSVADLAWHRETARLARESVDAAHVGIGDHTAYVALKRHLATEPGR